MREREKDRAGISCFSFLAMSRKWNTQKQKQFLFFFLSKWAGPSEGSLAGIG